LPAATEHIFLSIQQETIMQLRSILAFTAAAAFAAGAFAQDYKIGALRIDHPYARATVPNQPSGGAYVSIENSGDTADKLIGATSPVAKTVEIHTMSMDGNVMKMREVPGIELKPSTKTVMKPGEGYHLMLIGLKKPLQAGEKFPLTLMFEKAGKLDVSVAVEARDNKPSDKEMHHHKH
jgi:copper(I)-binding protein